MEDSQLINLFSYHAPKQTSAELPNQAVRYSVIREEALVLARKINAFCPESREKALAITNLQQAVMWANASIAINE